MSHVEIEALFDMAPPYDYGRRRRSSNPSTLDKRQRVLVGIMLLIGGVIVGFLIFLTLYYK